LRVTISLRSLRQASVELTPRRGGGNTLVPVAEAVDQIVEHPALKT
jgi:hypothetical protein